MGGRSQSTGCWGGWSPRTASLDQLSLTPKASGLQHVTVGASHGLMRKGMGAVCLHVEQFPRSFVPYSETDSTRKQKLRFKQDAKAGRPTGPGFHTIRSLPASGDRPGPGLTRKPGKSPPKSFVGLDRQHRDLRTWTRGTGR